MQDGRLGRFDFQMGRPFEDHFRAAAERDFRQAAGQFHRLARPQVGAVPDAALPSAHRQLAVALSLATAWASAVLRLTTCTTGV